MENLAYLHLAFDYEDCPSTELAAFSFLLDRGASPNWQRLSSRAWRYMLPLALTLSLMTAMSSAMALQKGDQGPSVLALQKDLRRAGFYQAPITQVYDVRTEDAVKRFQKAAGLQVSGVAGNTTVEKLENWKPPAKKTTVATTPAKKPVVQKVANKVTTTNTTTTATTKRRNVGILGRGDEGEEVRILQERLRVAGYYYGNATGIFGPITEASVKRFQTAYNLESDGLVGPATIRRLPPIGVGYGEDVAPTRRTTSDRLQLGDRGEAVRLLQEQLIKAGYLEGQPNGYFGPFTADAVKRFQAENYLAASGIAGPTTRAKLYTSVNTGNRNEFNTLEIQRRLMAKGFYKGPLNGVMGNDTKRAIRQAQDFYGISLNDVRSGRF
ncbi:peptidoglycan-binding protein [Calothrix sp. UHCC 0171]|uniref:peptidoglycan-binding domain-containing protein n=1 Tax=Calothrix sp. UHCC 0171 TaxID=3110245 RepID=UPI002B21B9CF|nr:peptidoglycan-binding protein [Calothrix sp. UHCC 0171]MEA5570155.1 peptidoglycan-binding protein [Calothrix sp. UHCC 0171]